MLSFTAGGLGVTELTPCLLPGVTVHWAANPIYSIFGTTAAPCVRFILLPTLFNFVFFQATSYILLFSIGKLPQSIAKNLYARFKPSKATDNKQALNLHNLDPQISLLGASKSRPCRFRSYDAACFIFLGGSNSNRRLSRGPWRSDDERRRTTTCA
jgi:hypothetical protein